MIGKLDERISFERKTLTPDGSGGASESWAEYAEVWASVRPMSGRERERAMRNESAADYLITIRRREILATDRIVWRERYLNIRFVKDAGPRAHYLEIEAELGAAT